MTVSPTSALLFIPALATGARFTVLNVTVAGALSTLPSFTTSETTYRPGSSTPKVGRGDAG